MSESTEPGHGHSPAAWTGVTVMLIGFALGTLFFVLETPVGVYISAVIVILGIVVWAVLARMGWGAKGPKYISKGH